jgi:hypothetical protein
MREATPRESTIKAKLWVFSGAAFHSIAGERSGPSHVWDRAEFCEKPATTSSNAISFRIVSCAFGPVQMATMASPAANHICFKDAPDGGIVLTSVGGERVIVARRILLPQR